MLDINLVGEMMAWAYLFVMSCLVGLWLNLLGLVMMVGVIISELLVNKFDYEVFKAKRRVDLEFVKAYSNNLGVFIPFYAFYTCCRDIILWKSFQGSIEQKLHQALDISVERTWQKIDKSSGK